MASAGSAPYQPNRPDQALRREALDQAVRLVSRTGELVAGATIVDIADTFYKFMRGDT